jgi:hypothetical protein
MVHTIFLVLGILSFILFPIACTLIVYNKEMTRGGKILRYAEVVIFPLIGSLLVIIEVVSRRSKKESKTRDQMRYQK